MALEQPQRPATPRVLVMGVNPFEDVPGYQLLGLLREEYGDNLLAADDSETAVQILEHLGTRIYRIPHPTCGLSEYLAALMALCERLRVEHVLPATDAHLIAMAQGVAQYPRLNHLCPQLKPLSSSGLFNKWAIQERLSQVGRIPAHWPYRDERDLAEWERCGNYPVMVKGMRKGAIKCIDRHDAIGARRALLDNPANRGEYGGTFLQAMVEGEEHSVLIVAVAPDDILCCVGLRKLATTKQGTTLAAQIEDVPLHRETARRFAASMGGAVVIELEFRIDAEGVRWFFEANLRFPSWIGALGNYGSTIMRNYLGAIRGHAVTDGCRGEPPLPGSLLYRLPESGVLPIHRTFPPQNDALCVRPVARSTNRLAAPPPLWAGCSPYQFLTK